MPHTETEVGVDAFVQWMAKSLNWKEEKVRGLTLRGDSVAHVRRDERQIFLARVGRSDLGCRRR